MKACVCACVRAALALLSSRDMLPAIWFIFSRRDCDGFALQLDRNGVTLTSEAGGSRLPVCPQQRVSKGLARLCAWPSGDTSAICACQTHAMPSQLGLCSWMPAQGKLLPPDPHIPPSDTLVPLPFLVPPLSSA